MFKISSLKPDNYKKIDEYLSRSAQPLVENLKWLREQGITDVINLRNMSRDNFDEGHYVKEIGMAYHSLPSVTKFIKEENVGEFLNIIENVKRKGGKVHFHCDHGADRTGMFAYIYERLNHIGTPKDNMEELVEHRWRKDKYGDLVKWAEAIIEKITKKSNS